MASPFTVTSVSNYNANPPADDGSQVASNRVQWSTQKTKLADPVYNAFNTSETSTSTAFGKVVGGAGITSTAVNYTVTSSDQSKIIKATAGGITITTPDATVVGAPFVFSVVNDGATDITFAGSGSQTIDGSLTFAIPAGCGVMVNTDGSNWFTDGQNFNNVQQPPQGYLTPTSLTPVITSDVTAATAIYYTPLNGNKIPISTNGTSFKMRTFAELTLTLVSNHVASGIYDVFVFDNAGTVTVGTGPVWNTVTAGSCARGTGAGTTELQRVNGILTNKNSMTARNGATTYTVAANEGTFVGSIYIDSVAGQVSCHRSFGQSRKWGISNCFHRRRVVLLVGDSTVSWNTASTWRESNGGTTNFGMAFSCLAEEEYQAKFSQQILLSTTNASTSSQSIGIGLNSTTTASGKTGSATLTNSTNSNSQLVLYAEYESPPSLGINAFNCLENTTNNNAGSLYYGTQANMQLSVSWMA